MPTQAPKTVEASILIPIDDVCTVDDGIWRPLNSDRVRELEEAFLTGQYGMHILKIHALRNANGAAKLGLDGPRRLLDGKHVFQALKNVKKIYEDEEERSKYEWTARIISTMESGVEVSVQEFDEDDDDLAMAWCVAIHDADSNKYRSSSLLDYVSIAERFNKKVPGGDWAATLQKLVEVYGKGKRTLAWRMVKVATTVSRTVLVKCDQVGIPNSYINENKFMMGSGAELPCRMSDEWRLVALTWYEEASLVALTWPI